MKLPYSLIMLAASLLGVKFDVKSRPTGENHLNNPFSIYDFKMVTLGGDTIDFSRFKGEKILLVNTASECGYTRQYTELQKLHEQHGDKVVILGFPCNQFGGQEPGNNEEIQQFCKKNYGVSFLMFQKIDVKGKSKHPLYDWLSNKDKNGWNDQEPSWNFCKYLVNEKGELVKFYSSGVSPVGKEMIEAIKN